MYQPQRSKNRHAHRWAYTISLLFHLILLPLISRVNLEGRRKHIGLIAPDRSYVRPIQPVELPKTVDLVPVPDELKPLLKEVQSQETDQELPPQQVRFRPKPILASDKAFSVDESDLSTKSPRLLTSQRPSSLQTEITSQSLIKSDLVTSPSDILSSTSKPPTTPSPTAINSVSSTVPSENIDMGKLKSGSYKSTTSEMQIRGLREESPEIEIGGSLDTRRKGRLLNGNLSGGGQSASSSTAGSSPVNDYPSMMRHLALGLIEQVPAKKIDLVFILDKTASMTDNIRGIRAYIDRFLDQFRLADRDVAMGLVVFSDQQGIQSHGVTTRFKKFSNWLHQIQIEGGGDLAESGLDAIMEALDRIRFRRRSRPIFVLATDGAFHDLDYDGQSSYSLDQVIADLQRKNVRVEVIGTDYLPVKQLALGTGGKWHPIPGRGYLEGASLAAKTISELGVIGQEIVIYVNKNPRPKWVEIHWKILNPLGERSPTENSAQRIEVPDDETKTVKFKPQIDLNQLASLPGTYTAIYRLTNDLGEQSVLRQMFER